MNILNLLMYGAIMLVLIVAAAGLVAIAVRFGRPHAKPLNGRHAAANAGNADNASDRAIGPQYDRGLRKRYEELDKMSGGAVYGLWE